MVIFRRLQLFITFHLLKKREFTDPTYCPSRSGKYINTKMGKLFFHVNKVALPQQHTTTQSSFASPPLFRSSSIRYEFELYFFRAIQNREAKKMREKTNEKKIENEQQQKTKWKLTLCTK